MSDSEVKGRVLIVDDEEKWRKTISQVLKLLGYVFSEAADLSSGLDALTNQTFDIVTIDMNFEEQGELLGETLLGVIRSNHPHIACIMISGSELKYSKVFDLQDAQGLDAFVHKSELTPMELEKAIEKAQKAVQFRLTSSKPQTAINYNVDLTSNSEQKSKPRPTVFISYSHKDEDEKDELVSHLGVLANEGLVDVWVDDEIQVGGDWFNDIDQTIGKAKVAILLITKNFLNSNFILGEEVPKLLERRKSQGLVVFPIIARPCAWKRVPWLTKMNVKPKNGTPIWREGGRYVDEELALIAETVADILDRAFKET